MNLRIFIIIAINLVIFSLNAATLNLNVGETVTIQPNSLTTVTCGETDVCTLPIKNLNTKFELCKKQLKTVDDCISDYWPPFKQYNGVCVETAYASCINFCKTAPIRLDCLELCK